MCRYSESAASPHRRTPTRRPTRCSARRRFRSVRSYGMKGIASIGLAAIMGAALASCTALAPSDEQGAGNSPDGAGDRGDVLLRSVRGRGDG